MIRCGKRFSIRGKEADPLCPAPVLYGRRVLIKDGSDNRYEISDVNSLDKKSRHIMAGYL